jgi:hypothetical protein
VSETPPRPDPTDPTADSPAAAADSVDDGATGFFGGEPATGEAPAAADVAAEPLSPREAERDLAAVEGDRAERADLDDDLDRPRRGRGRGRTIAIVLALTAVAAGALAIAGGSNAGRYRLTCGARQLVAERGRSFPPWGTRPMSGPEWSPITIPPSAECVERRTDDAAQLETWYLAAISDRVLAHLTPGERGGVSAEDVDAASALLDQGLLLTRTPARREDRKELERFQGDVGYWRAYARVEQAAAALDEAAKGFADAAARRPRHATDAGDWAERARRAANELRAATGAPIDDATAAPPSAAPTTPPTTATTTPGAAPAPTAEAVPAAPAAPPPGAALPVEPPAPAPLAAPPDAGTPAGGVLL